jgi:hypothetical protein
MLIFDASKNKKIQIVIESQGIASDKLKFTFTIDTGTVSYGFPCMFNEGRVEVDIPPLAEVIKDLKSGNYDARLDVTGDDKYYLKPFDEQVVVKLAPSIKKVELQDDDVSESIGVMVSQLIEVEETTEDKIEEEKDDKEEGKKSEKKTGISAFFSK